MILNLPLNRTCSNLCGKAYMENRYKIREKNNIDTKLVTNSKQFKTLSSCPYFKGCYIIDENKLVVKLSSEKIELKYPVFVGWYVFQLSEFHVYDLY